MSPKLFRVDANAIFLKNGKVLIVKCSKHGDWQLPGGNVEDESWQEGLLREIKEEIGLENANILKLLEVSTTDTRGGIVITCLCEFPEHFEVTLSDEHTEYTWCHKKDVQNYEFQHSSIRDRIVKYS